MKKVLVFLLIASLLSGSVFSGTGSIFCVTPDGHGEFEPINSDCCSDDVHSNQPKDMHDQADECSDCSDIEIANHFWKKRDKSNKTFHLTQLSLEVSSDFIFDQNHSKNNQSHFSYQSIFTVNIIHKIISSTVIIS